jgi:CHAT domain-containing protein/Tfp pilus assembly protein PilF
LKSFCKKSFLLTLLIAGWMLQFETLQAQKYSADSLYEFLKSLHREIDSVEIKNLLMDAQHAVVSKCGADSLATKLLAVENSIIPFGRPYPRMFIPFAEMLLSLTKTIQPAGESIYYEQSLFSIANLYRNDDQDLKSSQYYEQDLILRRKMYGLKDQRYEECLDFLAMEYIEIWQFKKALPLLEESLIISKDLVGEEHPDYAAHLNTLGNLYYQWDEYEKALPLFQQALEINRRAVQNNTLTETHLPLNLHNLATTYIRLGQYEKALPLTLEAFGISKKLNEHDPYAFTTNSLASLYNIMGEYDKALPLYEQALLTIKTRLGKSHVNYPRALTNLAIVYENQGKYDLAIPLLKEALASREKILGTSHPDYAMSLIDLANAYEHTGQFNKAIVLVKDALELCKKILGENCREYAIGLTTAATLYQRMGRFNEALPLFRQALAIREKIFGDQHPDYASSLKDVALAYLSSGKYSDSTELLIKATSLITNHLIRTYSSLSEDEKMKLSKKMEYHYSYLPSIAITGHRNDAKIVNQVYSNFLALKGIVLDNQQQILNDIRKSNDQKAIALYTDWKQNRSVLTEQLLLPVSDRVINIDSLEQRNNELEQQLSNISFTFRNQLNVQQTSAKYISSKLANDQAAVEFIRFNLYSNNRFSDSIWYAALVILPNDSTCKFVPLAEETKLQRLLRLPVDRRSSFAVTNTNTNARYSGAWSGKLYDSLYRLIWQPLEKYCKNIRSIYYSPVGLLNRIAFQALSFDSTHLLIEKYQLTQLLSTRIIPLLQNKNERPQTACVWGDIDYDDLDIAYENKQENSDTTAFSFNFYNSGSRGMRDQKWTSLPESKKEIDSLQLLFNHSGITSTFLSGKIANEEKFKALDGRSPSLIHIATHGFSLPPSNKISSKKTDADFSENPFTVQQDPMFRSGLVLAGGNYAWKGEKALSKKEDGILTSYEISQLDLSNTELLVLSACETALGDIEGEEGVMGLQRAFKLAGVKQMVLSLWKVPDKETRELMILFYNNLLTGHSPRESLRTAQLKMKEKYSPYYWAAFVILE